MSAAVIAGTIATTFALAPSVLYAALGEVIGQRAGIVNLGIEGVMLMSAAVGFAVGVTSDDPLLGVLAGAAIGCVFNLTLAVMVVTRHTNQLASGFAVYFLGGGLSTLIGAEYVGSRLNGLGEVRIPGVGLVPEPWDVILRQDILVWAMVPVAAALWWLLFRTRWGLHVRAVGEDKNSAFAAGLPTARLQYEALAVAGALSGLAGAHLALAYTKTWQEGMTAGRGFVAIVIVIFALWRPLRAIPGALLFSGAIAVGLQLQAHGSSVSPFLLNMLPYVLTIGVVLAVGRAKAFTVPAGLREVFAGTSK